MDLQSLSDEELDDRIAQAQGQSKPTSDLSTLSDEELDNKIKVARTQGQPDSIMKNMAQGQSVLEATGNFAKEHPFKTAFQGPTETITGETAQSKLLKSQPYQILPGRDLPIVGGAVKAAEIGMNTIKDMPASAVGWAADQASPANIATLGLTKIPGVTEAGAALWKTAPVKAVGRFLTKNRSNPVKATGDIFNKGKRFADDLIHGPQKATEAGNIAKNELADATNKQLSDTTRLGKAKIDIARRNADATSHGYENLDETLKKQVNKYSDKQGQDLQENLPKIFGRKSKEYGVEKDKIISSLPDERRVLPSDNVIKGIEEPLIKSGILRVEPSGQVVIARTPLTPTENQIFSLYESQKKFSTINVEDLIKTQKYIEPEFGKPWSPDDKLSADVARNFSKSISEHVPELRKLNSKYAPFLEWKNSAIDNFKPFNSQYDVATHTLAKKGSELISPSEQRLLAQLNKVYESPYGAKINALNKGIKTTKLNKEQAEQASQEVIKNLRNNLARDLQKIRQSKTMASRNIESQTQALIAKYRTKQAIAGIGLAGLGLVGGKKALEGFIKAFVSDN